ncbi:hypothetical protein NQ314_010760 [Rhamnusium bicolor]|uniref:Non-specific serine/threonine protein kinase n=1 Tax=Rhamnusium bicolor TaxID=1586634 RepID=A0AAV8XMW4_9CUCU|nr:hypothetical protein NQ314_010760 [Rhamnusium bicolor]
MVPLSTYLKNNLLHLFSGGYRGKFYEPEKKSDIKLNLPEDTRISKLLRRLNIETDQDNSLVISKKLLEVLLLPDNAHYVRKAFHILGESMFEILHVSPGPLAKQQAARALGRMGYIMAQENDFERYQHWLFTKMNNTYEEIQILLIKSFKETFTLEEKKPVLESHIENLINNLVVAIETTENAEVFKSILDVLVTVVEMYPSEFYEQFRDTIDLFLSKTFLEDITNYATQLNETGEISTLDHVTVLILAMNTVLKCLDTTFHPSNNKNVKTEFIHTGLSRIVKTVIDALESYVPDNLTIAGNDCISILLGFLDNKPQSLSNLIYKLIDLEISMINDLSDSTIISLLLMISKVIKELSANLPIELIEKLIGPKSDIVKLRYSPFKNLQDSVIFPSVEPFTQNNPFVDNKIECPADSTELTALVLLRCLSQLANASSIIVMWALKPSILELVGVNLKPHDSLLSSTAPSLQYCLLYLLYSHCKCYNHFISSSSLVSDKHELPNKLNRFALTEGLNINDVPNTSPNSENFAIILDVLYKTLGTETSFEVTMLLLQWFNDILVNSENYLENMYVSEKFLKTVEVLVKCGYHFNTKVALAVCDNLDKLLCNKQLSWSNIFLSSITDLCKLHMNSNKVLLRECYSKLSSNIPWDIAIVELNKMNSIYNIKHKSTNLKDYNDYMVYLAQHLHLNGTIDGEMYPLQFKTFVNYLLKNQLLQDDNWMEDLFTCCWAVESDSQMNMELFYDLAVSSRQVLNNWTTLEAAQFCVNYKLRTPLGKPNETFTKIEGALNELGNELITLKKSGGKVDNFKTDGNRVRLLLMFVEHLEKCIYNASEGCAMAMPPATKVVRSFFIANTNTCNEWFSRIRMVVMHTALHCGDVNIALRHGQCLLKDFVSIRKTNSVEFERVAMFVTLALLHLKETEALFGLYAWCKANTGKRFTWIKCAAEQASKKYELAVEGYKKILLDMQLFVETNKDDESKSDSVEDNRKLDADIQNFVTDQIIVCYKELSNWIDLFEWHNKQVAVNLENGRKYRFNTTDWECNKILCNMESDQTFNELSTWSYKNEEQCWSVYENLSTTETNLYNIAINLASKQDEDCVIKLDENISAIRESIQDFINLSPSEFLQNYTLLQYVANGLKHIALDNLAHTVFLVSENFENEIHKIDSCKVSEINVWGVDTARAVSEVIKLSYSYEENHHHTFNLCAAASTAISKYAELFGIMELRKISSKILLKLANWLQTNENISLTEMVSPLGKLIMVLPEIGMVENVASNIIPMNEMAIGKLLQFSVHHCGTLAKSWNAFGTWCYRWGRKIVDHSSDIKNNLSEEHCMEIKKLLPSETSEDDLTKIFLILSQTRSVIDEEDIDSNDINTSEMIQNQLQCVGVLRNATEEELQNLVQIWRSTQKRIYHYYALSAEAYFKYLHLVLNSENITKSTECNTITITLRLLRLIVKYALELQNILEDGLQTTPTQPWKVIIPQLFSRLNHPECYVRHRVSDLLCRVAEDAPHLITFPAVVGALEGGLKFDFSEITLPKDCLSQNNESNDDNELNEDDDNNYDSDNEESTNTLQTCFKTMVDTLSKQDPETIAQVQTLVKELRRITLLWDELWLGTLAQHQSEISKRQQQLEYEIEKVNENASLNKEEKASLVVEKHRIIIKPIIFILEQLLDVTSVEAETPHEKQFQEKYLEDIKDQKFHKRASYSLKMQDISPVLYLIKNTVIAMPGLATTAKKNITISHVSNIVSILPTKTKPKKLVFYGSDGQTYTYLFKGLEDLHLDERIMQFLSIANTMMAQNADPTGQNLYRARHYSVIPLGPRSGLISWVDGTTPAFALYKRWQQRGNGQTKH